MPAWIHARADRLKAKNPDMAESTAFAVATQQSHALGKSPKGYGTDKGREKAKEKYKTPGDDKKTAAAAGSIVGAHLGGVAGMLGASHAAAKLIGTNSDLKLYVPVAIGALIGSHFGAHLGGKLEDHINERHEKKAMDSVMMSAMADEFAKIALSEKDSGFLGDIATKVKNVAMTDVGGPKGILQPAAQAVAGAAPKAGASKGFQAFQQKYQAAQR